MYVVLVGVACLAKRVGGISGGRRARVAGTIVGQQYFSSLALFSPGAGVWTLWTEKGSMSLLCSSKKAQKQKGLEHC